MSRGKTDKLKQYEGGSLAALKFCYVGFGLLEVMLALFILSFSLLALANFTTAAWRRTYDAYLSSLAVNLAANRVEAAYAQDVGRYSNVWQQEVAIILPQGQGSYTSKKSGSQVKVCWQQLFHKHKFCYTAGA